MPLSALHRIGRSLLKYEIIPLRPARHVRKGRERLSPYVRNLVVPNMLPNLFHTHPGMSAPGMPGKLPVSRSGRLAYRDLSSDFLSRLEQMAEQVPPPPTQSTGPATTAPRLPTLRRRSPLAPPPRQPATTLVQVRKGLQRGVGENEIRRMLGGGSVGRGVPGILEFRESVHQVREGKKGRVALCSHSIYRVVTCCVAIV